MLQLNAEDVTNKVSRTYQSGHPAGNTALVVASAPTDSWVCELGERLQGILPEVPGTRPVWADLSARAQERSIEEMQNILPLTTMTQNYKPSSFTK